MKKGLLFIAFGISAFLAKAQVVFNIQSPSNLAGNYMTTYADPGGGWGSPDMLDPLNALTDTLVLVDDGTSADSLGCNALINGAQVSGQIALIYRGSCQFGTKALNAQNAGAVAVVVINNAPGDPVGMGSGNDGANVTIPVFMISQIDGSLISSSMDNGNDVVVFLGNKFGLFDTDLGLQADRVLLPNPNSQHALLAQNGTEHNFRVGAWVFNYGNNTQNNATFAANVTYNGNSIYSESMIVDPIAFGDTFFLELPIFEQTTYPAGKYTMTYSLTTETADEYDSDNTFSTDFYISNDVFSYVKLDSTGLPASTTGYRTSTATSVFSSCIHFRNDNASRVKTPGLYFSAVTNTNANLLGQEIILSAYQWDNVFTDLNDPNAAIDVITEIGTASYIYEDSTLEFTTVYAPFNGGPITLLDGQRYLFCATTYDPNTYIGYGDLVYNLNLDTYLQPLFPIQTDTGFDMIGFGGEASAIGVKLMDVNTNDVAENSKALVSIYPNPSSNVIYIKGSDLMNYQSISLVDGLGRTVSSWTTNGTQSALDVSKFENGNYFIVLNGTNGSSVHKVQIMD